MNLSSSNCLKTSPIICPIDCSAFKSSCASCQTSFESQSIEPRRAHSRVQFLRFRPRARESVVEVSPQADSSLLFSRARLARLVPSAAISLDAPCAVTTNPAYFLNASRRGSGGGAAGSLGVVAIASAFVTGVAGVCAWSSSPSVVVISPFDRSRARALILAPRLASRASLVRVSRSRAASRGVLGRVAGARFVGRSDRARASLRRASRSGVSLSR